MVMRRKAVELSRDAEQIERGKGGGEGERGREEAIQRPVTRTGAGGAGGCRRGGWDGADGEARGAVAGRAGVEACSCELDGEDRIGQPR